MALGTRGGAGASLLQWPPMPPTDLYYPGWIFLTDTVQLDEERGKEDAQQNGWRRFSWKLRCSSLLQRNRSRASEAGRQPCHTQEKQVTGGKEKKGEGGE